MSAADLPTPDIKRPPVVPAEPSLSDLVSRIKSEHARLLESTRNIIQSAIVIGENLLKAKDQVGHGNFLKWVKDNCNLSDKTAERYMKFAKNKTKLTTMEKTKFETISNLTLKEAERLIDGKPSGGGGDDNGSDAYDKAAEKLVAKLKKLKPDEAEAAVNETINKLKETLKDIKQIANNAMAKAA